MATTCGKGLAAASPIGQAFWAAGMVGWEFKNPFTIQDQRGHPISLVEDDPDLLVPPGEGLDGSPQLVTDVQLVGIKQQQDQVHSLSEPGQHLYKVVSSEHKEE